MTDFDIETGIKKDIGVSRPIRWVLVEILAVLFMAAFLFLNFGKIERFLSISRSAEPTWVFLAVACQVTTYAVAGNIWGIVARSVGLRIRPPVMIRLAVEKLTLDQVMPSAGLAGHVGVLSALRRSGLPASSAMEAVFLDIFSFHAAYASMAALSAFFLAFRHDVTPAVLAALGVFSVVVMAVVAVVSSVVRHREAVRKLPRFLAERAIVARAVRAIVLLSPERIFSFPILSKAIFFQVSIFFLDAVTLWATLRAFGATASLTVAFAAFVIGAITGTVSFVPGGIGTFEAGATATLVGLGIPFEGALAGVFLFRGLAFWLPIVPGLILAHRDLSRSRKRPEVPVVTR